MIEIRIPTRDVVAAALKGGPEHRFIELCNGLIARTDETRYPGETFFFRDKTLMIEVERNKNVWFRFLGMWTEIERSIAGTKYYMAGTNYEDVQEFLEGMVKKYFVIVADEPLNFDAGFIYTTVPDETVSDIESHFGPGRVGTPLRAAWAFIEDHFTKK